MVGHTSSVVSVPANIAIFPLSQADHRHSCTGEDGEKVMSWTTPSSSEPMPVPDSYSDNRIITPMRTNTMTRRVSNDDDQVHNKNFDTHRYPSGDNDFYGEPDLFLATAARRPSLSSPPASAGPIVVENNNNTIKNYRPTFRRRRRVRFAPGAHPEPTTKRVVRKRKKSDRTSGTNNTIDNSVDPACWYTKKELKKIQESCIVDVMTRDFVSTLNSSSKSSSSFGDFMLDRFSEKSRKRRKLVRWQMYQTTKVVKEFEKSTETKVPDELLSGLLKTYSKPMEMDAIESALKATSTGRDDMLPVVSKNIDSDLACTRRHLEQSLRMQSPRSSPEHWRQQQQQQQQQH